MRILYSLLLVGVAVVWGWTFVVVQDAIALYGVLGFLVVRFALAALRWFEVVIPKDATSALDPFDLESSLRQTSFLFTGKITQSAAIKATV